MEIQIAALCDSAVDYGGKLCVLGAFDTILTAGIPTIHPQCSVALRVVFRKEDEGTHNVSVNFVDEDGKAIVPAIQTDMEIALPEDFYFSTRNLVLNIQQLQFERAGLYAIDVAVDGRQSASIPLQVMLAEERE
jgi:hypothetical protein